MDVAHKLDVAGLNVVRATDIMRQLNLSSDDFMEEYKFLRFVDVVKFFGQYDNYNNFINKLLIGKNIDKLDHLWTYQELARQKHNMELSMAETEKKLMMPLDDFERENVNTEISTIKSQIDELSNQMYKYEI